MLHLSEEYNTLPTGFPTLCRWKVQGSFGIAGWEWFELRLNSQSHMSTGSASEIPGLGALMVSSHPSGMMSILT